MFCTLRVLLIAQSLPGQNFDTLHFVCCALVKDCETSPRTFVVSWRGFCSVTHAATLLQVTWAGIALAQFPSWYTPCMSAVKPVFTEYEQEVIRQIAVHRVQPNAVQ